MQRDQTNQNNRVSKWYIRCNIRSLEEQPPAAIGVSGGDVVVPSVVVVSSALASVVVVFEVDASVVAVVVLPLSSSTSITSDL